MKSDDEILMRILIEQADHNLHVTTIMMAIAAALGKPQDAQLTIEMSELSESGGRFLNLVRSYIDKHRGA